MNQVQVKISGLNLPRLVNRLVAKNICIRNLVTKKKYIKFYIEESELSKLNEICKSEHKFYIILKRKGLKNFFIRLPYFLGTILALIISYAYIFSISQIVINVNLNFRSEIGYDLTKVKRVLSENGITSGMNKNKFTSAELERLLMLSVDDIEGCSVKYSGGNLNILVYPAKMEISNKTENLYSKYDGVIIKAEAHVGNLKVKAGQIVRVGDMLIENINGAQGEIKAKVYFTATQIYNENQQETIYTGNYVVEKKYTVCNKISFKRSKPCTFSQFTTKKCGFYLNTNFFLPIYCEETIYYEVNIKDKFVPFEENELKIKESTYNSAFSKIPQGAEVGQTTYSVVREGNFVRVDCFIETEINLV